MRKRQRKHSMRLLREKLKISQLQVERATEKICERIGNRDYFISKARLSQIEETDSKPSPAKIASLAIIYGVHVNELLEMNPHWWMNKDELAEAALKAKAAIKKPPKPEEPQEPTPVSEPPSES